MSRHFSQGLVTGIAAGATQHSCGYATLSHNSLYCYALPKHLLSDHPAAFTYLSSQSVISHSMCITDSRAR